MRLIYLSQAEIRRGSVLDPIEVLYFLPIVFSLGQLRVIEKDLNLFWNRQLPDTQLTAVFDYHARSHEDLELRIPRFVDADLLGNRLDRRVLDVVSKNRRLYHSRDDFALFEVIQVESLHFPEDLDFAIDQVVQFIVVLDLIFLNNYFLIAQVLQLVYVELQLTLMVDFLLFFLNQVSLCVVEGKRLELELGVKLIGCFVLLLSSPQFVVCALEELLEGLQMIVGETVGDVVVKQLQIEQLLGDFDCIVSLGNFLLQMVNGRSEELVDLKQIFLLALLLHLGLLLLELLLLEPEFL